MRSGLAYYVHRTRSGRKDLSVTSRKKETTFFPTLTACPVLGVDSVVSCRWTSDVSIRLIRHVFTPSAPARSRGFRTYAGQFHVRSVENTNDVNSQMLDRERAHDECQNIVA